MSVLDKVVAAVTPLESDAAREEVRTKALAATPPGGWLGLVIQHHRDIETALAAVKAATTAAQQTAAQKKLATLLTGHSIAEETVLYPALVAADEKTYATTAYTEQSAAKTQMALLESLPPLSEEYLDKLEHIRGAVTHHMYEEEKTWFFELNQQIPAAEHARLTARYKEEFNRYVGGTADLGVSEAGTARRSVSA